MNEYKHETKNEKRFKVTIILSLITVLVAILALELVVIADAAISIM